MATQPGTGPKTILMVTNVEAGEANVFLATAHALLQVDPDLELHFASFGGLEASVASTWQHAQVDRPGAQEARPIKFHEIQGLSMEKAVKDYYVRERIPNQDGVMPESFLSPLGISNTIRAIQDATAIFTPWSGPQLARVVSSISNIIKNVNADLVVVDSLMTPALTACYHLGVKFTCLSPNSIKEFVAPLQPHGAGLWKYPALFSGFSFPVPVHKIPLNIYFVLRTICAFRKAKKMCGVEEYMHSEKGIQLRTPVDLLMNRPADLKILVSSLPELDFPAALIPPHVVPCGPIIRSVSSISDTDPAMEKWLSQGPTVYISLGSHCKVSEDQAVQMARALKALFNHASTQRRASRLQVLWKLKHRDNSGTDSGVYQILSREIENDAVRIMEWVPPEPISVLQSGHIACSVHHGGGNSYNEAISAGVPQVVLPQWTDCYDYAQRVEMLGIGRLGSQKTMPYWSAQELGKVLIQVVLGDKSATMLQNAKKMAEICRLRGDGATAAAHFLLRECSSVA